MMRRGGASFLLVLVLSCYYVTIVQSYDGMGYDLFKDQMRRQLIGSKEAASHGAGTGQHSQFDNLSPAEIYKMVVDESLKQRAGIDFPVYVGPQDGLKAADKIQSLPGQPSVKFNQYSGYVNVDEHGGRALFYYFVESTKNPSEKPLVLWLNGGPGCSSMGTGAMMALGPFRVNKDGKTLKKNEHAWNQEANILFLESPVGVGFSYSKNLSEYSLNGDTSTMQDSYRFLINWLERFPEYKNRDFYITGESYAGHYIPQLARVILLKNKEKDQSRVIKLRGIAVGNGGIDKYTLDLGINDFLYSHDLICKEQNDHINMFCKFESPQYEASQCGEWINTLDETLGNINIYDIYAPVCNSSLTGSLNSQLDPCSGNYVNAYLNSPQVQKALHANITSLPYPWSVCMNRSSPYYGWSDGEISLLPTIKELMASDISVWLYSGDTDAAVPVTSTKYAIASLNLTVKTDWYQWYDAPEDLAGYVVEYHNLTFVTVRGAGHVVPRDQPARALKLFSSFIEGKLPPRNATA